MIKYCLYLLLHSFLQVIEELRKLRLYIEKETGEASNITGVGLASRKHLCINPEVRGRGGRRVKTHLLNKDN